MKANLGITILAAMMALAGGALAESSGTNGAASVPADTNAAAAKIEPLIEMHDVPLSSAIESLARRAGANYLPEPGLLQKTDASGEPVAERTADFRLKNVTAKDVLMRLLNLHHLVLMEDPVSNIAIIARVSQSTNRLFSGMSEVALKFKYSQTNELLPLILLSDVPITTAIENLARQEDVRYMIDPRVSRQWWDSSSAGGLREPLINLRLEHITAWNTLNRMLNVYNLVIIDNPITHIWQVRGADELACQYHPDASLLGLDTNNPAALTNDSIPLIEFSDVQLYKALEALIRQASLPVVLDPQFKDDHEAVGQIYVSLRWEDTTAKQAIIAICQNYDLDIVKDGATGGLRIEPGAGWK
jgi:hypothetical protein